MALPVYVSGQVLNASDCNTWFMPQIAYKTADGTTVTSSTTFINDTDIVIAVAANAVYRMSGVIFYRASAAGDMQIQWTYPTGALLYLSPHPRDGTGGTFIDPPVWQQGTSPSPYNVGGQGASTFLTSPFQGLLVMSSTGGNLQLQYTQVVSDPTACQTKAGTYLELQRVG